MVKEDWRNPNMLCYACLTWAKRPMKPHEMQNFAAEVMDDYDARPDIYADENWRNDPTYHLRRKPNVPHKI